MLAAPRLWLAIVAMTLSAGCSLVVDFDRSRLHDAGVEDAGERGSGGAAGRGGTGGDMAGGGGGGG